MNTEPNKKTTGINWPEAIVSNLIDAVVVMDREGIIRYVNTSAQRLTGKNPSAVPGKPASLAFRFLESREKRLLDLPTTQSFEERDSDKPDSIIFTHVLFAPPRQREIIVNAIFTPIRQDDNTVTGVIIRFRDITQAVQLDRKKRDKQKIQAIGTMANSVASEFTNWLALISGHASAIIDNLIPRTRAYEEAANILDATKRATGLTKRLLSLARTRDEANTLKPKPIRLESVIRNAMNQAQTVFGSVGADFKIKMPTNLPLVLADDTQLLDCFMNLFRNAFDSMPEGGTIVIDFPASRIPFPNHDYVIVRIRDTGHGMEKHVLERVFDPFYSTRDPSEAIGLGLTVVQTSVEQWGGMVKIRSRPGRGTSVRLFLRSANSVPSQQQEQTASPSARILVVDDQQEFLDDLGVVLESAGYRMHATNGADECLSFYSSHAREIDLVIIDVIMPGKDGKKLLEDILNVNPQAAVIMTSGFSRDYVRNYLKRGTWGFVQKPVDPDYLISTIQRMLEEE